MRREQFDESVKRSLYNAAHKLELYETMRYLEKDASEAANHPEVGVEIHQYDFKNSKDGKVSSFEMRTIIMPRRPQQEKKDILLKLIMFLINYQAFHTSPFEFTRATE